MKQGISANGTLKFIGMSLATGITGALVGYGMAYLLSRLLFNHLEGWGGLVGALIGLVVFYPLGVFLGQLVFKLRHFQGSLWRGGVGIILGGFLTIGLANLLNITVNSNLLFGSFFILTALLGTAGYFLGRISRSVA